MRHVTVQPNQTNNTGVNNDASTHQIAFLSRAARTNIEPRLGRNRVPIIISESEWLRRIAATIKLDPTQLDSIIFPSLIFNISRVFSVGLGYCVTP